MSLLTQASLVLTPTSYKANKLYSIVPSNGNGDMTVTRATTATRTNSSGIIETVELNVPRIDYTSGVGSILLEPQRTNLLTHSEDISKSSWASKSNISTSLNEIISPNGTLTADKVIADTSNNIHRIANPVPTVSGSTYTYSVYAKAGGYQYLYMNGVSSPNIGKVTFDLVNGTFLTGNGTASISNMGNGWYRCVVSATANTTLSTCFLQINNSNIAGDTTFTGDGTSGIYIWGAQLEQGAYATSYIPTVASTVTRNTDIINRSNIYTNGLITSAGGTWFIELNNNFNLIRDTGSRGISISDTINNFTGNAFYIRSEGTTSQRLTITKYIADIASTFYLTTTDTIKLAIKWNGSTADYYINGTKVVSATAFTTTAMEYLYLYGSDVPKYIKSTMLFPTPLTDAECASLTTL